MRTLNRAVLVVIAGGFFPAAFSAQPPATSSEARIPAGAVKLWALTPAQEVDPTIAAAREALQKFLPKTLAPQNPPRYLFVPVTPCTVFDTRYATNPASAGFVSDGMTKYFTVSHGGGTDGWDYTAQGGADCLPNFSVMNGINAEAVLMTAYVSDMSGNGWITFYRADAPDPSPSTISVYYSPGPTRTQTVATSLAQNDAAAYEVAVTARYGGADVSASVTGFFIRQEARPVGCTAGPSTSTALSTAGDSTFTVTGSPCPTGYNLTSLTCTSSGDTAHVSISGIDVLLEQCSGTHTGTGAATVTVQPICCRVPPDVYPY